MKHIVLLVMAALFAVACASGPPRRAGDEAVAYLDYAGEPIGGFTSLNLQSWQPLSRNRLVLWTGVDRKSVV